MTRSATLLTDTTKRSCSLVVSVGLQSRRWTRHRDNNTGAAIYDRGLPDCIAYAQGFEVDSAAALVAAEARRYADPVFIAPPWEEIYTVDDLRRMTFAMVEVFHRDLVESYETLGYDLVELPRSTVADRVAFVESCLDHSGP